MPQVLTITAAMMADLPGTSVSETTDASGYTSFAAMNVSPYFWQVRDSLGNFLAPVPPWSFVLGNVQVPTVTLTVVSDDTLPQVPVAGVASSSYQLRLELSTVPVSPSVTTLAPAMAANSVVTATISAPVGVQGVTGGTAVGVSIGETVDVSLQSVAGNVPVTVQSGAITATISGTVGVQGVTGGVAVGVTVGNTVNVAVQNSTLNVAVVSASTTLNVSIQNSQLSVTFPSAQEVNITEAITLPANVTNDMLAENSLVFLGTSTTTITNLAAGASVAATSFTQGSLGLYDGVIILVYSAQSLIANYKLVSDGFTVGQGANVPSLYGYVFANGTTPALPGIYSAGSANSGSIIALFADPVSYNGLEFSIENTSSATISSDTVTCYLYGIKAQVSNPQSNPVQSQAASGSFDTLLSSGGSTQVFTPPSGGGAYSASATIFSSGNYVASLNLGTISLTYQVDSGDTCTFTLTLYNGSDPIAAVSQTFTPTSTTVEVLSIPATAFNFGHGIANNGISITGTLSSTVSGGDMSLSWNTSWGLSRSTTPPQTVTVVN